MTALADVFAVQDEITAAVAKAVLPAVSDAELRRILRKLPENLGAWEAYQRGLWHVGTGALRIMSERSSSSYAPANSIPPLPRRIWPWPRHTSAIGESMQHCRSPMRRNCRRSGRKRALAIDPEDADTHATMAYTAMVGGRSDEAHESIWRLAKASNPDLPNVFACEGFVLLFSGQPAEARQAIMCTCVSTHEVHALPFRCNW